MWGRPLAQTRTNLTILAVNRERWDNACTETLKGNLGMLPHRTQRLNLLCESYAGRN
jgi:hypothetical protein